MPQVTSSYLLNGLRVQLLQIRIFFSFLAWSRLDISPKCSLYASAVSELWLLPSPRSTCLFQETFLLKPWTLWSIAFYLHSQRTESAVSSLIHVIQLFHKLTVTVTSPSFVHSCNWNQETTHGVFSCAATADLIHAWTVVVIFFKV